MPTVRFKGNVLPSAIQVSINGIPKVTWPATESGLQAEITVSIINSIVDIECQVNRFHNDDLAPLYMRVFDLTRACVDLTAFATGNGLTVFLHTLIKPEGESSQLAPQDPSLAALCTVFQLGAPPEGNLNFSQVLDLVLKEPALFMALNDLIGAITLPHHAPVNCARAIEGLRNLITPLGTARKEGWSLLRTNLKIEQEYLEYVTHYSTGPRHGDRAHIPGTITREVTRRAWIIMNRFLEFRKRGNQALPESEFPMISS